MVTERRPTPGTVTVPAGGAATAVVKLTYCICRKPGLGREEFIRYWADVHGPIGARIPGVRKLVQSYALAVAGDTRPPDFDGMAELWSGGIAEWSGAVPCQPG